jgi:hypothetical protein
VRPEVDLRFTFSSVPSPGKLSRIPRRSSCLLLKAADRSYLKEDYSTEYR